MEEKLDNLSFFCIEFSFYAKEQVHMDYWFGAVLRSRFLNKAEEITNEQGVSLRTLINTLPLPENHFMYKQLKGGFPKGFVFDCSGIPYQHPGFTLEANTVYTITLYLVGNCAEQHNLYIEATRLMLEEGFNETPLHVTEINPKGRFSIPELPFTQETKRLELYFLTPVNLVHIQNESTTGFQGKLNNFPSFYQFMRSVAYRMLSLKMLYTEQSNCFSTRDEMDKAVDEYITAALGPVIQSANIRLEKRYSTPKLGKNHLSSFEGYTGRIVFNDVPTRYFALLVFASALNIGTDINYGLGTFRVKFS